MLGKVHPTMLTCGSNAVFHRYHQNTPLWHVHISKHRHHNHVLLLLQPVIQKSTQSCLQPFGHDVKVCLLWSYTGHMLPLWSETAHPGRKTCMWLLKASYVKVSYVLFISASYHQRIFGLSVSYMSGKNLRSRDTRVSAWSYCNKWTWNRANGKREWTTAFWREQKRLNFHYREVCMYCCGLRQFFDTLWFLLFKYGYLRGDHLIGIFIY